MHVREWLIAHVPENWREQLRGSSHDEYVQFQQWWLKELRAGGLLAPHWPVEWGGGGRTLEEQVVLYEEMARFPAPRPNIHLVGLHHTFHTLLAAGTEEQRAKHLPAILDGEIWCQGFSEPEAGSDLASLRTRAERDGDVYVVNGQKVWSSYAADAKWCLLLARTDHQVSKTQGITFLLMEMDSPGITVRPIRQATGNQEFSEVFLDNVRIPVENLVGEENQGWQLAQVTLAAERGPGAIEMAERVRAAIDRLIVDTVRRYGDSQRVPTEVKAALSRYWSRAEMLRELCIQMIFASQQTRSTGYESSVIKLVFSELLQDLTHYATELSGPLEHYRAEPMPGEGWDSHNWLLDYIGSYEWTIAGGTNDIQRNLISERILDLPREPRWTA
ncbi:alkylation response protein AidB-like acyl-CoA dehydrogenase [Arthrobacter sp. W4I7]|nr:alkylation response protein AidB-like acyl-CoA dehydrogenase [Arthrobacter sp. W4I7]